MPGKGPQIERIEIVGEIPVLPLRNSVFFPGSILPIDVARERSLAAVERAKGPGKFIAVVAQKDAADEGRTLNSTRWGAPRAC